MRHIALLIGLALLSGCAGPRSYTRSTEFPLPDAYACAERSLEQLGYQIVLADTVGGTLQGQREITGIRESARRGAAAATEIVTIGLAGGRRIRFDELTVFVYTRRFPLGNTVEASAGMLTVQDEAREQGPPSDAARADARLVVEACAG